MCVLQFRWAGYRGPCSPALLLLLLLIPLSFLSSTPPFAQGAIHIPKNYKVHNISQPPVLTEMPASYTAFSRDDINLTCEATGNPTPMFRWVKDGNEFGSERTGSGSLRAEEDEPLSTYQGTYRCYASNNLGTAMTHAVQLIIEPQPILPKQRRIHKKAEEGESMILPCNPPKSSIRPNIHWMDSEMFHITRNDRVVKGLDGNLYFANILKSDSRDDYTCHAQYPDARTILPNEPVTLTVISSNDVVSNRKPHLFHPSGLHSSVLTVRGNSLTLECIPRGLPTPTVEWRKKDGNIKDTGAQLKNFNRWLHFRSISQEDDGEYECKASNSQGSAVHSFTVTVEAKPYWVKEPQSLLYAPGETVRLDCQAEGIPTPTITWSINGLHLTEVDKDPRRTVSGGVLILRDVEFADTAVYQCEAFNKHGSILTNTYIYVIELPPQILSSDGVVYQVIEGRNASLDCETFGSPRPHVTWEGDGMLPLLSDSRVSLLTNGTIELSNVGHDDSGTYTCSIRHTNISIMAHLEVLNRTVILNGPQHVRTLNGTSALLDCHFYKDPRLLDPQIVWKRDGAKILESSPDDKYIIFENATLKLTYVQLEDTGNYSCEVITSKDHVAATGSITVVARPDPPHSLTLSDVQDRSLTLSWKPGRSHNSHITEFIVEAREEQHTPERKWRWEEWKWVSGDINHLELMLQPYSTYRFRVIGVNEAGRSEPSQHSEAHTTPPAVPDGNPTGVHSDSTDPGFLVISWDEMDRLTHNAPGFEYKVSWRQAEGSNQFWSHGTTKGPPFVVNGTGTYTPFEIKVQAVNSLGEGPAPVPEIGHSGEDTPLEAPGDVTVKVINSTASVRWETPQGVRGLLLGYRLYIKRLGSQSGRGRRALGHMHHRAERERDGGVEHGMGKEQENRVVEVGSMKNSEEVTGLRLYSRYELSVTAFNSKGEGPHSPPYHFSTPEGAPGPPASLRLDSPSETSITLYWTPPIHTNGVLLGYFVQFKQDMEGSTVEVEEIMDPSLTHHVWDGLDPHSSYIFTVTARTAAGEGPPITRKGTTLLDGVPPTNISCQEGETYFNLSWVPGERHRNHGFQFRYLKMNGEGTMEGRDGGEKDNWVESEMVNSTQGFYSLAGLQPGTKYWLTIMHRNYTHWKEQVKTKGPELSEVAGGFATQGWFIGLISAIVLLMLILLILCFIKRSKGGKYAVKDKEDGQVDSEARPMKDETFGEYSDGDEKRSISQPSLCVGSKLGSDDSLAEYGNSVDIQFNEDGSFIGQYSGREPVHHGNESSGPASPVNPVPPPPIAPSMSTFLDRPS
ncbi:neural cell adhesion molecule L1.1-like isoform X2 [Myripristis murdjan]|uniref:neural cell adhesion molecule L1.1-like isoform X2 n=1 Tax=Myripristis murdjan TaxID=586833 RepID=UPI001175C892|nr:neural cell adhesion molecule L1.1-like isoform X2 [Myripristis murdjan]